MADINNYGQPGSKLATPSLSEWAGAVVDVLNGDNTTVDARITAALAGVTVPSGGTADQIIVKIDGTDGNYEWRDNGGPTVAAINQYNPATSSWTNFNGALVADGFGGNGSWTSANGSRQLVRTGNIIQYFDGPNAVNYIIQRFANATSNVMAIKPGGLFLYNATSDSSVPTARSKIEPTAVNTATLTSPGTLTIDTDATMAAGHHLTLDADPVNNLHAATKQYVDNNSGGASNLDGLTDVTISNPQADQILGYNGSAWVNTVNSGGGGGTSDHGDLIGLGDDDHTQYLNNARGDARYYTKSQVDTSLSGKANTSHTHTESQITDLGVYPDATSGANGQIPQTNGDVWTFIDTPSGGGGATDLNSLTDVTVTTPASGEVLSYNGSAWVNSPVLTGNVVSPDDFGAVGNGIADDTLPLQNAVASLSDGDTFLIPAGKTYRHTDNFNIDGLRNIRITGTGEIAHDSNLDSTGGFGIRNCVGVEMDSVTLSSTAVDRRSGDSSHRVFVYQSRDVVVRDLTINGSAAAGILFDTVEHFEIRDCAVNSTLADSVHMTHESAFGYVSGIVSNNSGDDAVAVVSYDNRPTSCHDIHVRDITVTNQVGGRAVGVVGGENILMESITATNIANAGIYVACEGSFSTRGVKNVRIRNVAISQSNQAAPGTQMGPIMVYSGRSAYSVDDVLIEDVTVTDTNANNSFAGYQLISYNPDHKFSRIELKNIDITSGTHGGPGSVSGLESSWYNLRDITFNTAARTDRIGWSEYSAIPTEGSTGQVLTKASDSDYDLEWSSVSNEFGQVTNFLTLGDQSQTSTSAWTTKGGGFSITEDTTISSIGDRAVSRAAGSTVTYHIASVNTTTNTITNVLWTGGSFVATGDEPEWVDVPVDPPLLLTGDGTTHYALLVTTTDAAGMQMYDGVIQNPGLPAAHMTVEYGWRSNQPIANGQIIGERREGTAYTLRVNAFYQALATTSDLDSYPSSAGQPATRVAQTDGSGGWTFIDTPSGGLSTSAKWVWATPEDFTGIDPSGATDSLAGFQAFVTAIPDGGVGVIPGGTYLMSSNLNVAEGKTVTIIAYGATFVASGTGNLIQQRVSRETTYNVSTVAELQVTTYSQGAEQNWITRLTLASGNPTWRAGDVVQLFADDIATPDVSTSNVRSGETFIVAGVSGTQVDLAGRAYSPYTTNVRVARYGQERIRWMGGTFRHTDAILGGAAQTGSAFYLNGSLRPEIRDVRIEAWSGPAIYTRRTFGARIESCSIEWTRDTSPIFGYGVLDSGTSTMVDKLSASRVRHAYATGGGTTVTAGDTDARNYGLAMGARISNSSVIGATQGAWDTHGDAVDVQFSNCTAVDCYGGFILRGVNHRIQGGYVKNAVFTGVDVGTASSAQYTYGHVIGGGLVLDNCSGYGIRVYNDNAYLETRPVVIDGVTITNRPATAELIRADSAYINVHSLFSTDDAFVTEVANSGQISYKSWRSWTGTQAQYDALGTYDPATLYVVNG